MSDLNRPDERSGPPDLESTEERLRREHGIDDGPEPTEGERDGRIVPPPPPD